MALIETRRGFLGGFAAAGAADLLPARRGRTEPAVETTSVRLAKIPGICIAPQYFAEELLREEGFTDVRLSLRRRASVKPRRLPTAASISA
jgi:NitT/TauT family transport system substrate-binding protein